EYREARPDELFTWDATTVRPAGGHVLQSRAWAEHRATRGWHPRFLVGEDGSAALALSRPWPIVGGASAYVPRGPAPTGGYEDVEAPTESFATAIGRFHDLALQTADRRHFALGSRASFLDWTTRAHAAAHLILLLATDDGGEAAPVAGLMLYRHGGRLSTA